MAGADDIGSFTTAEMGYPSPQPSPPGGMPPGDGRYTTPNFLSFSAIVRSAAKAYLYSSDEALRDSVTNARAMRRDPVLLGALRRRQRPVAQLTWSIEPDDETNPAEVEAAKLIEYVIKKIPKFQKLKMQLLEAIWFGKYGVEVTYEWREHRGEQKLFVRDFIPINGDKLRVKWDGTYGVLVYAGYPGTKEATDYGLCHFLTPDERLQYIIHEHEPDDADWVEPEMAGSIHGVGVRGRLYWFWWLKQQVFAQLMNYIQRFANGLTIFYYDASNPEAKREAELAAQQQYSNTALLYPRWNSENPDRNKVERLEVGTASPNFIFNIVSEYFDPIMERYIEGQTLSSNTDNTGLGSGVADAHGETLDEIVKYDAVDLQETLQSDLVNVLYAYNAPGITPGTFTFAIDDPNSAQLMEHAQVLFEMGVPLDGEQLREVSQWRAPKEGSEIVTQVGGMQPAAVGQAPQGVPVAGQPGAAGPPQPIPGDPSQAPPGYEQQGPPQQMSRNGKHKPPPLPRRVMVVTG